MVESKWSNTILPVKTMPTDNAGEPRYGKQSACSGLTNAGKISKKREGRCCIIVTLLAFSLVYRFKFYVCSDKKSPNFCIAVCSSCMLVA